jgi:hypothetical protein
VTASEGAVAEIDAILAPVRAANPGITNSEAVLHLPERLHSQFWARAIGQYAQERFAKATTR